MRYILTAVIGACNRRVDKFDEPKSTWRKEPDPLLSTVTLLGADRHNESANSGLISPICRQQKGFLCPLIVSVEWIRSQTANFKCHDSDSSQPTLGLIFFTHFYPLLFSLSKIVSILYLLFCSFFSVPFFGVHFCPSGEPGLKSLRWITSANAK